MHYLRVRVSTDNGQTYQLVGEIPAPQSLAAQTYFVDLTQYVISAADFFVVFEAEGFDTTTNLAGVWLDNLIILGGSNLQPNPDAYESNDTLTKPQQTSFPTSNHLARGICLQA